MANKEREQLWKERVAQLQDSSVSQRAYGMELGFSEHRVAIGYAARRSRTLRLRCCRCG